MENSWVNSGLKTSFVHDQKKDSSMSAIAMAGMFLNLMDLFVELISFYFYCDVVEIDTAKVEQ